MTNAPFKLPRREQSNIDGALLHRDTVREQSPDETGVQKVACDLL